MSCFNKFISRAKELLLSVWNIRYRKDGAGNYLLKLIFGSAFLAVALLLSYRYVSPAVVALLVFMKTDFPSASANMTEYMKNDFASGWSNIAFIDMPGIDGVISYVKFATFAGFFILGLYMWVNLRKQSRLTVLGTPKAHKSSVKGGARVITNQLQLLATSRTWNPDKPIKHAGLVLGYSQLFHRYFISGEQQHTQTVAPPGAGKTTRVMYPTIHCILASEDSAVIYDPKGEIHDMTVEDARASGRNVIVIDYSNWRRSDLYNTLTAVADAYDDSMKTSQEFIEAAVEARRKGDNTAFTNYALKARNARIDAISRADETAKDLLEAMIPDLPGSDHFWRPSGRSLGRALALAICTYRKEDWISKSKPAPDEPARVQMTLMTMRHLLDLYGKPMRRMSGNKVEDIIPLEENFFSCLAPEHPARRAFAQAKNTPGLTVASICSTLLQELDRIIDEGNAMMSYDSSFTFEQIADEPTIVYLIVPEESPAKKAYLPIFTIQAYQALVRKARREGGSLARYVHFVQEELGNSPKIQRYENMIATGRGYGLRFHAVVQSTAQWRVLYGSDDADVINEAITCTNYVNVTDEAEAKKLSAVIGKQTVSVQNTTSSRQVQSLFGGTSGVSERLESDDVVPASKILEWDPLWGSFIRRSEIERGKKLNFIYRIHESHVCLYPTAKPKQLPTWRAFGIQNERASYEKRLRAASIDKSADKIIAPMWDAVALQEGEREFIEGVVSGNAIDALTESRISQRYFIDGVASSEEEAHEYSKERGASAARNWFRATGETDTDAAFDSFKTHIKHEMAAMNRIVKSIERDFGLKEPYSCEVPAFVEVRKRLREAYFEGFIDEYPCTSYELI